MKFKVLLVIISVIVVIAFSGFIIPNNEIVENLSNQISVETKINHLPLHNDIWFAFSAIAILGGYILIKKN